MDTNQNRMYLGDEGFLDNNFNETVIINEHNDIFMFCEEINKYAYRLYNEIRVYEEDIINVFFAITFSKIHKDFQSVVLLLKRGLKEQACAILRVQLERYYIMKAITNDHNYYNEWVLSYQENNRRTIKKIINRAPGLEEINLSDKDKSRVDEVYKRIMPFEWAERAELQGVHNTMYTVLSNSIHYTYGRMDDDMIQENSKLVAVDIAPTFDEIDFELYHTALLLLCAISIIVNDLGLDMEEFKHYEDALEDYAKKIENKYSNS